MANTLLTPDMITREALVVLHQKLNFVGNVTRDYDDAYANSGAKIGNTLRIRNPIQYATGTGATMATGAGADTIENKVTLTVNSQRHVPMRFTSNELTMKLDDFSKRHIEPAMSVLAAKIENDAFSMVDEVYNNVQAGTADSDTSVKHHHDRRDRADEQHRADLYEGLHAAITARRTLLDFFHVSAPEM